MTRNPVIISATKHKGVWMAPWETYSYDEENWAGTPEVLRRSLANRDCFCGSGKKVKNCPCTRYRMKR